MRVFMSGATGFIGRALALRLRREGHAVCAWVRDEGRARSLLGAEVDLLSTEAPGERLVETLGGCDAVVNLAGASVIGARWSAARKRELVESRVGVTARLVEAMAEAGRPRTLVSASAVGFYGDRGDEALNEESDAGEGFLARLCRDWEEAARRAEARGVRVVRLRMGVVFGREGGALAKLLPPFRAGVGGRVGSGRQYAPWIHLHDVVEILAAAVEDERLDGAVNAVAPEAVTNADLTRALGRALHRWTPLPIPPIALRAAFGEGATTLVSSQRVVPGRLLEMGFRFRFPTLEGALADLVDGEAGAVEIGPTETSPVPSGMPRPRFRLRMEAVVLAPVEEVFSFFSAPENLGAMTPPRMRFRIVDQPRLVGEGARIEYRIRMGPFDRSWRTRIEVWQPGAGFVDSQVSGPYRIWWHEHAFRSVPAGTHMEDRVWYGFPLGWLGGAVQRLFVEPELRRIFTYRRDVIRLRFGMGDGPGRDEDQGRP
ncbi:MAG TPA: TIGR01777 family oxidoreductase [Vulgatibacter sp.]|nr:TIGR01777 family oxidoreductase [Vulgatibacter sp.]